jgi:hypothetical protein
MGSRYYAARRDVDAEWERLEQTSREEHGSEWESKVDPEAMSKLVEEKAFLGSSMLNMIQKNKFPETL